MTSQQIEIFLSVAETLNFTHSAKKLYSSQSTVSRQIGFLEEELGFELFVRGNNFVRLTPAGATMYATFSQFVKTFSIQKEIALSQNKGNSGSLRFGFYCNMHVESFLSKIIEEFHIEYPNIHLYYECIPFGDIENSIREEHIDLAFVHDFDELNENEFVMNTICNTNQFLLYGKSNPLANKPDVKFEDFKDEIFWSVETRNPARRQENMKSIFSYYGIDSWNTSVVSNFETILLNIRLGKGAIFIDPLTYMINNEYYNCLALPEELSKVGINITWLKSNLNPAIALFTNRFF